jgi:hypothetical protein
MCVSGVSTQLVCQTVQFDGPPSIILELPTSKCGVDRVTSYANSSRHSRACGLPRPFLHKRRSAIWGHIICVYAPSEL